MTVNTAGLETFRAGLPQVIDAGVQETAEAIERTATGLVPVDTGALRTSIQVNGAEGTGERTVEAGQGLDYAPFVEYGSSRAPAQPFMTPAAEQNRPALAANIERRLKDLADRSRI